MDYLSTLNEKQLEAVTATEGYLRVIAGAGSGKTKLLVSRYAYLVKEYGINSANILCVTFTNASFLRNIISREEASCFLPGVKVCSFCSADHIHAIIFQLTGKKTSKVHIGLYTFLNHLYRCILSYYNSRSKRFGFQCCSQFQL